MRRSRGRCCPASVLCALSLLVAAPSRAQDPLEFEPSRPDVGGGDWGLAVTPYAWFAANSTDVGTRQLRQSFNDLASIMNVGFQGRVIVRWRWAQFAADWTYADLGSDGQVGPIDLKLHIQQNILDMKLGGKVYDTRTAERLSGIGVWVAAGARYWENDVEVNIVSHPILPGGTVTEETFLDKQSWWDPVLGVTLHFPVSPKVGFLVRTTGGGLGIGSASTFMWDAELGACFRLTPRLRLDASYRTFKYSRTDGEGDEAVKQTVTVNGPALGLSVGIF